jgi:hypothetical protein
MSPENAVEPQSTPVPTASLLVRKGTLCIRDGGGEMPGWAIRNNSVRIVQFNRKAREGRKETLHIQRVDPGELEDAIRKIPIRQFF